MKTTKRIDLSRLFYNNKFLIVFSIIVAFIIWMIISLEQNPTRTRTFTDITVNLSTENTVAADLGLDIISGGIGEKVNVTVSGPNYIVSSMETGDILVSASLSEVSGAGTYDLTLSASQNSSVTDYSFVSITPEKISVTLDYIDTKEFTVTAEAVGASAVEGLVVDTPVVSDSGSKTIIIKGPRTEMQKIGSVVASATVNKTLSSTESFDADIKILDVDGNEMNISNFTIPAGQVKISVPIVKRAVLPITVSYSNAPGGFDKAVSKTLSHDSVTVLGPEEIISNLKSIPLTDIDVTKITKSNNSFDVSLALPDGVKTVETIEYVTVKFATSALRESTVSVDEIKYINGTKDLVPATASTLKNVKICGPSNIVKKLKSSEFYAVVDLSGKKAGEYTVPVSIVCKSSDRVWQIGEYNLIVTLK